MDDKKSRQNIIAELIQNQRIYTFENLSRKILCSEATLRRDIKEIGAISSYTHGGMFITLPTIPQFNEYGIWFHRRAGFAKFSNSLELIVDIINNSATGVTKKTLDEILRIDVYKQIYILLYRHKISRVKTGKRYIYISEKLASNKKKRQQMLNINSIEEHYAARVTSADLVALLKAVLTEKKIKIDAMSLKRFTQKYYLRIPVKKVEQLLLKYDLTEKKTPSN